MYTRHIDGDEVTIFQFSDTAPGFCRAWSPVYRKRWPDGWTPWFETAVKPLALAGETEISRADALREIAAAGRGTVGGEQ